MKRLRGRAGPRACLLGCAAWLLSARAASAQTERGAAPPAEDSATSQARALFNDGTDKARLGDWSQALPAFERSEALRPHAVTTYNIGFCERVLGRTTRARKMLGKALAENAAHGGVELPEELATAARTYLAELERRVAHALITLSPAGASIVVDGRPLERAKTDGPRPVLWAGTREPGPAEPVPASTFELELDPGAHVLVVTKAGYVDQVATQAFEAGADVQVILRLSPPAAATASRAPEAEGTGAPGRLPLYVALGIGGAGLATGAIAGGIALAQQAKLPGECPRNLCSGDGPQATLSRAGTAADVSTAGFVVGGVGAATAAMIWWLSPRAATPAAQLGATGHAGEPGGGTFRDVRLTPWIEPSGGGVSGTF